MKSVTGLPVSASTAVPLTIGEARSRIVSVTFGFSADQSKSTDGPCTFLFDAYKDNFPLRGKCFSVNRPSPSVRSKREGLYRSFPTIQSLHPTLLPASPLPPASTTRPV